MASSGNTWFKKLETKAKAHAMKAKLGNERGIMSYCVRVKNTQARDMNRQSIEDKPTPKGPSYPKKGKLLLPRVTTWKPEPYPVKAPSRPLNTSYGTHGKDAWR